MAPLRIAVLECDKPLDQARIKLGAHAGVWRKVFEQASHFLESPVLTSYDVVDDQNYPDLSSVNGILVSGSRYSAYGEEEWVGKLVNFVSEAIEKRIPVVGICFGHQIVARALGAEVARGSGGWEVGPWTIGLNKTGQELFGKQEITLNLMNRDIVQQSPAGVEQIAYRAVNPNHGMYSPKKVLTVQGHPEFNSDITGELLKMRLDQGIIPQDKYDDAMLRLDNPTDGIAVAKAILKFYTE